MRFGPLHVRKRFLGTLIAVGLVTTSSGSAIADYFVELPPLALSEAPEPPAPITPVPGEIDLLKSALADHQEAERQRARTWVGADGTEVTADQLERFLAGRSSPLAPYALDFVQAGRAHDVDPRVVVAIAGIESSFGRRQRGHNAWGWGGGPGGTLSRWPDWPTAIDEYTRRLGDKYDTTVVDEAFARRYVPPNWRHWLSAVHQFMGEMDAA